MKGEISDYSSNYLLFCNYLPDKLGFCITLVLTLKFSSGMLPNIFSHPFMIALSGVILSCDNPFVNNVWKFF